MTAAADSPLVLLLILAVILSLPVIVMVLIVRAVKRRGAQPLAGDAEKRPA